MASGIYSAHFDSACTQLLRSYQLTAKEAGCVTDLVSTSIGLQHHEFLCGGCKTLRIHFSISLTEIFVAAMRYAGYWESVRGCVLGAGLGWVGWG